MAHSQEKSTSGAASSRTRAARVRCEDCAHESRNIAWSPNTTCPRCGSVNFSPVPVIKRGCDYLSADRSQGFAIEDIRFARLAQWAEFITAKQAQQALFMQREIARAGRPVPDLGSMFRKDKTMTRGQVRAVMEWLCVVPGNRDDVEFARSAIQQGYVTEKAINECLRVQREAAEAGHDAAPLPLILYEKRAAQETQIVALLKLSESHEKGLTYRIKDGALAKPQSQFTGAILDRASPQLLMQAGIAAAVLLALVIFLAVRLSGPGEWATVECANCGAVSGRPANSQWPLECTECKQISVYPQAICLECGKRFPVKGLGYGIACPKCHSSHFVLITNRVDLAKLLADIKAGKTAAKGSP